MNILKIKHKEFEIIEIIKDDVFKCERKDKFYFIKKYNLNNSVERSKFFNVQKLHKSNIKMAKLFIVDKRSGYVVLEYLSGITIKDYILEHDFDENMYKQVFLNAYMARVVGYTLDYRLDQWMLVDNTLYYIGDYCDKYLPSNDFSRSTLSLWFLGKDLYNYYEKTGILFDKTRLKDEFTVNKEMVLMTCKYYQ